MCPRIRGHFPLAKKCVLRRYTNNDNNDNNNIDIHINIDINSNIDDNDNDYTNDNNGHCYHYTLYMVA